MAIIDLNTKRKIVLSTRGIDCDELLWSPNGKLIAYRVWNEKLKKRDIAIINADNTGHRVLSHKLPEVQGVSWMSDSKKIVVSDSDSIFLIDLLGKVTGTYKISDIVKSNSGTNFRFTVDGKKIVFLGFVNEIVNSTGGSSAVFVYDMATKKALRVSPKGYNFTGVIIHNNKILASGEKAASRPNWGVYSIDLDGKNFKLFLPNAGNITVKN